VCCSGSTLTSHVVGVLFVVELGLPTCVRRSGSTLTSHVVVSFCIIVRHRAGNTSCVLRSGSILTSIVALLDRCFVIELGILLLCAALERRSPSLGAILDDALYEKGACAAFP
jgi:hypothetical protein